jgi:hypothetical protein
MAAVIVRTVFWPEVSKPALTEFGEVDGSSIEAALGDLDSLCSRSAAGEERVAPSKFAVLPGAFCYRADHVVTSEKRKEVASRRLTFREHLVILPSCLGPLGGRRRCKFYDLAIRSGV